MLRTFLLASIVAAPAFAWEVRKDSQGDVVRWDRHVEFVIDARFAQQLGLPGAPAAVTAAAATLSAQTPSLEVTVRQGDHAGQVGYSRDGANENSIVVLTEWPYEANNLAVTLVTLNAKTNTVLDADIALNAKQHSFLMVEHGAAQQGHTKYDLQNTLTHELGHALGLMHTNADPLAVMYPSSAPGETCKRTLSADDIDGLNDLYAALPQSEPQVGCSASPGRFPMAMIVAVILWAFKRRARLPSTCAALILAAGVPVAQAAEPNGAAAVDEIAWGEVVETSSRWLPDARVIVTDVEVEVLRCVKGACAQKRVHVQVLGGRVGDIEQVVEHQPSPQRGGQVVLTKRNGLVRLVVSR